MRIEVVYDDVIGEVKIFTDAKEESANEIVSAISTINSMIVNEIAINCFDPIVQEGAALTLKQCVVLDMELKQDTDFKTYLDMRDL